MRSRLRRRAIVYSGVILAVLLCVAAIAVARSWEGGDPTGSVTASVHYWRHCEGVIKAPTNRINAHNLSCKEARDIIHEYLSNQPESGGPEPSPRGFTCNQRPIGGQKNGSPGPYRVACNRTQDHRIEQIRYFWG